MAKVADIWNDHGVQLTVDGTVKRIAIAPPGNEIGYELTALATEWLAAKMRDSTASDGLAGSRFAFVPRLGSWGRSYSPLTVLKPRLKGNPDIQAVFCRFDPFSGPIAIVTTKTSAAHTTAALAGDSRTATSCS